ncbi:hypothetical protein TB2_043958 [Malus domestica]
MITDGCQSPITKMQKRENQDIPRVVGKVANALKGIRIVEWEGRIVYLMKKTSKRYLFDRTKCGHLPMEMQGEAYPLTTRRKGKAPQGGGRWPVTAAPSP